MSELLKKLQIKPSYTLLLLHAPEAVATILAEEESNFTQPNHVPVSGAFDGVLLFVQSRAKLELEAVKVLTLLKPEGLLWIAYPKRASGMDTDLTRDKGWGTMAALGYEPVRQVAIDDTWSALRFRPIGERKTTSMFGIDMPGIDRKTKTVTIPDDMQQALLAAGLLEMFEKLAFTHRKEYVVAVLQAKRPETRVSRIQKAVAQLRQKQDAKV